MSRYGAYSVWKQQSIGSIEVGILAEIVLLNGDFLAIPVDELGTLTSVMTIIGGKVTSELLELRGNTLWFDTDMAQWIIQMNTPTSIWRWKEAPRIPPFYRLLADIELSFYNRRI